MAALIRAARSSAFRFHAAPLSVASRGLKLTAPQKSDLLESKTGKTGAAVLGLGLAAYLASKEVRAVLGFSETIFDTIVNGIDLDSP